jgi:pimeloyl-ACP methyl ester carboxylesterase
MGNDASAEIEIFAAGELEHEFTKYGGAGDLSVKKLVEKGYNDVIRTVIRPPRARYSLDQLGDESFSLSPSDHAFSTTNDEEKESKADDERHVRRTDVDLTNDRGLQLRCSHWQLYASASSVRPVPSPCLVYLHSNMGSRLDALRLRDLALLRGFSVFAFDCSGSGESDGLYVTCGWNESKDLHFVLQHLDENASVTALCFYAHSMGTFPAIVNVASHALLQTPKTRSKLDALPRYFRQSTVNLLGTPVKGMVLDGAYSSMKTVTEELMATVQQEGFKVPLSLLKLSCAIVQKSVKKRADVDLDLLRPVDLVEACSIPALWLTGEQDRYVASHHSHALAKLYGGPSVTLQVDGDHYSARSDEVYANAIDFLFSAVRSVGMR